MVLHVWIIIKVILLSIYRHFSRKYPIQLIIKNQQSARNSPAKQELEPDLNWFDFEEIKDVSATFLDKERQYELEKEVTYSHTLIHNEEFFFTKFSIIIFFFIEISAEY